MPWESSNRRANLPSNWAAISKAIIRRDRGICYVCHRPGADQADHVIGGNDHRWSNLAAIHDDPCHRVKSSAEGHAARPKRRRPAERHPGLITDGQGDSGGSA